MSLGCGRFRSRSAAGTTGTPTVTFKQSGEKITGTYSSQVLGERELTGTVKGNALNFELMAEFDGNKIKVVYSGTVEKDTMKGKVSLRRPWRGHLLGQEEVAAGRAPTGCGWAATLSRRRFREGSQTCYPGDGSPSLNVPSACRVRLSSSPLAPA